MNGEAGKGDKYRDVNQKKWEEGWIKIFGKECPGCKGQTFIIFSDGESATCRDCNGLGKVDPHERK